MRMLIICLFTLSACVHFNQMQADYLSEQGASQMTGNADVIFVRAISTGDNIWTFYVTVQHPDTGWDDYANGWNVVLPDGTVIIPNSGDAFTRVLLHPHETEQPFTRSQSNIFIPEDINTVTVRAHDLVDGWGGKEITVHITQSAGEGYTVE